MIDTHAHIYLEQFRGDLDQTIERSKSLGVKHILMPNIDHASIDDLLEVEYQFPEYCSAMMGLHPCSVTKNFEKELYLIEEWLERRPFIAVGEIGTDLYWDTSTFKYQEAALSIQVGFAQERNIPVVIHCRESLDQTLDLLESMSLPKARGVFHCFTGTITQAERIIALGFKLGVGGVVTFKNSGLDQTLKEIDLDHVVLETDSPYLAPVPYRGKRNEPGYLIQIKNKLMEVYDKSSDDIVAITSENASKLFKLNKWNTEL